MKKTLWLHRERGKSPFKKWFLKIKDVKVKSIIMTRIDRLCVGSYGDCKPLGGKLFELRVHVGAGYRIYFTELSSGEIVLLLLGGEKKSQVKDINSARKYLKKFLESGNVKK